MLLCKLYRKISSQFLFLVKELFFDAFRIFINRKTASSLEKALIDVLYLYVHASCVFHINRYLTLDANQSLFERFSCWTFVQILRMQKLIFYLSCSSPALSPPLSLLTLFLYFYHSFNFLQLLISMTINK